MHPIVAIISLPFNFLFLQMSKMSYDVSIADSTVAVQKLFLYSKQITRNVVLNKFLIFIIVVKSKKSKLERCLLFV